MDALGPRFERFLAAVEPDRAGRVIACESITGGYSRVSARALVRWGDGAEETFILRGDPPPGSGVFTSDRDAEWDLLSALPAATSVSTPVARWYDRSGEHLGAKAIVMDCAAAVSLQDEMARASGVDTDPGPLADLFVDTFAAIHQTPLDALPDRMARPADGPAYVDGVLSHYDRMASRYPGSAPVLRYVSWWARAHQPPPVPLGLVHGDCQPSNVLVGPAGPPLVIDWEFGHIGDPREDLGYYTQIPLEPNVYFRHDGADRVDEPRKERVVVGIDGYQAPARQHGGDRGLPGARTACDLDSAHHAYRRPAPMTDANEFVRPRTDGFMICAVRRRAFQRRRCRNDAHPTTWLPQRRRYRRPRGTGCYGVRE
jgi:aminoglycoside phosphotransferase (APT) family kinase protein